MTKFLGNLMRWFCIGIVVLYVVILLVIRATGGL